MKNKKNTGNTFWHEPFCEALKMELRDYADILDFLEEEKLAANSLSVDIIVRKKRRRQSSAKTSPGYSAPSTSPGTSPLRTHSA